MTHDWFTQTAVRVGAAVASGSLLTTGAIAVFVSDNGPGTAALLGVGLGIGALTALGERLQSLRFGEVELQLRAAQLLTEAERADEAGDREAAGHLRAGALALLMDIAPLAQSYEHIRRTQAPSPDRTATLGLEVARARDLAAIRPPSPVMVQEMFDEGSEGMRVIALGLMQGSPASANCSSIVSAIRSPRSDFEQYHAILVADQYATRATAQEAVALCGSLEAQLKSGRLRQGGARWLQATKVARALREQHPDLPPDASGGTGS